jgi:hypothetical protein
MFLNRSKRMGQLPNQMMLPFGRIVEEGRVYLSTIPLKKSIYETSTFIRWNGNLAFKLRKWWQW